MSLAFYAPLKSPDHPTPSGDRRMARALIEALGRDRAAGRARLPAAQLRSRRRSSAPATPAGAGRSGAPTSSCAATGRSLRARRPGSPTTATTRRRTGWVPRSARALSIPYLLAEASFAPKQAGGPWALGHRATEQAIRQADVVIGLTRLDLECLAPLIAPPAAAAPPAAVPRPGALCRRPRGARAAPRRDSRRAGGWTRRSPGCWRSR